MLTGFLQINTIYSKPYYIHKSIIMKLIVRNVQVILGVVMYEILWRIYIQVNSEFTSTLIDLKCSTFSPLSVIAPINTFYRSLPLYNYFNVKSLTSLNTFMNIDPIVSTDTIFFNFLFYSLIPFEFSTIILLN